MGPRASGPAGSTPDAGSHLVTIERACAQRRTRDFGGNGSKYVEEMTPDIPGAESLTFNANIGPGADADLNVQLTHTDQRSRCGEPRVVHVLSSTKI